MDKLGGARGGTTKRRESTTQGKEQGMNVLTYLKFALVAIVVVIVGVPVVMGKLDAKDGATLLTSTVIALVVALGLVNAAQVNAEGKVEAQKLAGDQAKSRVASFMGAVEDKANKDEETPT
jgi:hypothetical protein